jgi:hypothetical protein
VAVAAIGAGRVFATFRLTVRTRVPVTFWIRETCGPSVLTTWPETAKLVILRPLETSVVFCAGSTRTVRTSAPTKLRVGTKT